MAARALMICTEFSAIELRRRARLEANRRASLRMLAIANALDGLERGEAARLAGMSGQALCDAVKRYNAMGLAGLYDLPKPGRPPHLDAAQERELCEIVLAGPDVEKTACPPIHATIWRGSCVRGGTSPTMPGRSAAC